MTATGRVEGGQNVGALDAVQRCPRCGDPVPTGELNAHHRGWDRASREERAAAVDEDLAREAAPGRVRWATVRW